jgi:hypothetical protein
MSQCEATIVTLDGSPIETLSTPEGIYLFVRENTPIALRLKNGFPTKANAHVMMNGTPIGKFNPFLLFCQFMLITVFLIDQFNNYINAF